MGDNKIGDIDGSGIPGQINDVVRLASLHLEDNWNSSGLPDWVGDIDQNGQPAEANDVLQLAQHNLNPSDNPLPQSNNPVISSFVSLDGSDSDSSTGKFNDPYATLEYALSKVTDQNNIFIKAGEYKIPETMITKDGITIQNYPDDKVIFTGTETIRELKSSDQTDWQPLSKTVITDENTEQAATLYTIKLRSDVEIWQLFDRKQEVINARWPSAQWTDDSVFSQDNWGHGYEKESDVENTVKAYDNGEIVDIPANGKNLYDFVEKQRAVNSSDFTTTGSLINLNVGSFKSYTKVVTNQQLLHSSDQPNKHIRLSYDPVSLWKTKHHYYYLENKLEYLNTENEWFFDNTTKQLYVWLTNNRVPDLDSITAKTQSYTFNIDADNVTISGFDFFSTTLKAEGVDSMTIQNCNFVYPSCYAHMINQINEGTTIQPSENETFVVNVDETFEKIC